MSLGDRKAGTAKYSRCPFLFNLESDVEKHAIAVIKEHWVPGLGYAHQPREPISENMKTSQTSMCLTLRNIGHHVTLKHFLAT